MVVEVRGTLNEDGLTGQATEIFYKDIVEGLIDDVISNSPAIKILTILGQQVVLEEGVTAFSGPLTFANVAEQNGIVEVSGFRRGDGLIQGTYVELKPAGRFELVGAVSVVGAGSFILEGLTVVHSSQTGLVNGDVVKVEGDLYDPVTKTLQASSVTLQPAGFAVENADRAEIEGYAFTEIEPVPSGTLFQVNGQDVRFTQETVFSAGSVTELLNNTRVEVEGTLIDGVLIAEKIKFEENVRLQGQVTDLTTSSLTLSYPDDEVGTSDIEIIVDQAVTDIRTPLAEIVIGDFVQIRGFLFGNSGSTVLASRLRKENPDDNLLRAPVARFDSSTGMIELLGVAIDSDGLSIRDNGLLITQEDFFFALQEDKTLLVQAQGSLGWVSLELER